MDISLQYHMHSNDHNIKDASVMKRKDQSIDRQISKWYMRHCPILSVQVEIKQLLSFFFSTANKNIYWMPCIIWPFLVLTGMKKKMSWSGPYGIGGTRLSRPFFSIASSFPMIYGADFCPTSAFQPDTPRISFCKLSWSHITFLSPQGISLVYWEWDKKICPWCW